ncbi:MAG: hypothetical protein IPL55_12445 [Saprospiraceae bacterium]|nr:hypothetical protein [Saprospiraceae bacterium]
MIFKGINNQTVELNIINYQYPYNTDGGWDSNWLNIYLIVKSEVGNWHTVDPSLTTWDVHQLITWFDILSKNLRPEFTDMRFTEPNLSFVLMNTVNDDSKKFRIFFNLESRPKSVEDNIEYYVDIVADNVELKRITADLQRELDKYPERRPEAKDINLSKDALN